MKQKYNIVLCCFSPYRFASLKYKLVFPYCSLWVRSGQGEEIGEGQCGGGGGRRGIDFFFF